ncbi:MAG: amino acid permease [Gemmatimonadota bacterium]|nr:amino acid permease [Gemmatimonadota bacterium]
MNPRRAKTPRPRNGYGTHAAAAVVVANMIGTGVFTSLGFQLLDLRSTFPLLLLWVVGGAAAFCGAVSYAELGAAIPRSGGEHAFLSRIYHPAVGLVSGWISATIGFAAPAALAAITFGTYLSSVLPSLSPAWLGAGLVVALAGVHATTYRNSSLFQRSFTTAKVVLILAFCASAVVLADPSQPVSLLPAAGDGALVFSGSFAVSLIYVSYAYTGWNAATYLTGEVSDPQRTLPRVLAGGTLLVTVLYVGLNYAFLRAAPMEAMEGRIEVGYVAATHAFGPAGAAIMGVTLAVLLVSTVSAMVMAGPRVLQVIGEDHPFLRRLSRTNRDGIPAAAIMAQAGLTLVFIVTASFETILVFAGFTLGLNSLLAVAGVFVLRVREPDAERPYRAWGFPFTPLAYLAVTLWTLLHIAVARPAEALTAIPLIGGGLVLHAIATRGRRAELG